MFGSSWRRRGLIYAADERLPWAKSHAQIPTVEAISNDRLSILFAARDQQNRSHIAKLEVETINPRNVIKVYPAPVLALGALGTFDDCGQMPSDVVDWNGCKYLFYIGWNVRNTIPYHNAVGLAVSEDGGISYRRLFDGPVMDRTAKEPFFCATTCILIEDGVWRNWYLSCTEWITLNGVPEPRYHLKYAESTDGISWTRASRIAIDYENSKEGGIVRASVIKDGNTYKMWYSYRGVDGYRQSSASSYRIGYAESPDGLSWTRRDDQAGIAPSADGWDSSMLAYPEVVDVGTKRLMFYNGNGFGTSGFGYAETERPLPSD